MSSDNLTTSTRALGRPVSIDPDAVAALALRMFAERGYEQTSMEDIARDAGVGRKTLYRHFATKAELVWGGMGPAIAASAPLLDSPPAANLTAEEVLDGLRDALVAGVDALPDLAVTRGRLRLIAEHPELMSRSYEFLGAQRDRTRSYLTARGVPEATARYFCAALIGASFEAWLQWAAGQEPTPTAHLQAALAVLHLDQA
ncbi:TetR/AcrR family transcriptional regulator [Arthrobacter sp. B6]|uniref:TetR/AcrR family transcriptional regulator n=1 Tax=Arthrobacter sp. B6 TaxID=1570137 RepID=UPI00082F06B9|nr:TetR/AcrR family transcriptional regulator [Arthrobacter sp. B6]